MKKRIKYDNCVLSSLAGNGKAGYNFCMSARILCLAAISIVLINNCNYPEEYSAQAKVNTKVLTIYEEPNPYAREVGYVKEGETVRLTSRTFGRQIIDYQQSHWYGVKTNNNKTGWVYGYHLGGDKNKMDGLPVDWNAVFLVRPREKMNNSYGEEVISPIFPGTGLILEDTPLKIDPAIQSNTLVTLSKYSKVRYIVDSEEKEKKGFPDWVKVEEMK
jgi:hypothetical protein